MDALVYQYSVGGVVFAAGLYFAWRQGYVGTSGAQLRNLVLLVGGLAAVFGIQAYLQYAPMEEAAQVPYTGEPYVRTQLGTPIDYAIMVGYFVAMLAIGTWFGRGSTSTKDFFFGGQRFSWWLIAFSMVATTIGSYSFVKYSKIAFGYGIASSQTYLNDWLWAPLLMFGWLPLLYFSRVVSIPEYFARRFGPGARQVATWLLLVYLVGYVGINLFTMGQALSILLGWPVFWSAAGVAAVSAVYVTFGGQTSVIMTDLFQGAMLLATGLILLLLGIDYLGGFDEFWVHLPRGHRQAFVPLNEDPNYPAVGIFWQDAMANSAMFYFLNQGMVMRLLSARSVKDSRKAVTTVMLVLMPIAALVVASGGWVAKALTHAGVIDPNIEGKEAFFVAADFLAMPGVFGLIMAALTAALMSTVDTLVTAVAAIAVNDLYVPRRPKSTDEQRLRVARISSVTISVVGVALVPVFMQFGSIYSAHGAFTAAVTPPLVVSLLLGVFWRRYTPTAALWTMVGGSIAIFASVVWPELIAPFAHGVPMKEVEDGFLAGKDVWKFMRAFYGIVVCAAIGVGVSLFTKARPIEDVKGLVWGTVEDAIAWYKGAPGKEVESDWAPATARAGDDDRRLGPGLLPVVTLDEGLAATIGANVGDLVYLSDARAWLGGLKASHAVIDGIEQLGDGAIVVGPTLVRVLGGTDKPLRVKRLY
ncbi:MAG: sodium/solute symporter [Proteobacteria bacterium]|nr:sodium/solute symporter [Pseudomonadota bacterium]MCP4918197.1 sodium/solute symporter [Pseudomonadota bacterium]